MEWEEVNMAEIQTQKCFKERAELWITYSALPSLPPSIKTTMKNLKNTKRAKVKIQSNITSAMMMMMMLHFTTCLPLFMNSEVFQWGLCSLKKKVWHSVVIRHREWQLTRWAPSLLLSWTITQSSSGSWGSDRETAVSQECWPLWVTFHPRPPPIQPWEQPAADTRQTGTCSSGFRVSWVSVYRQWVFCSSRLQLYFCLICFEYY